MYANKSCKNSRVSRNLSTSLLLCLTAALVIILTSGCARITKGPFLLRVAQDRAAIMWETNTQGSGKLSYGRNQRLKNHIVTEPKLVEYEIQKDGGCAVKKTAFIHKTWLENLEPGQTYGYRITCSQTKSKTYSFRTQSTNTDEVTFVIYGDNRSYPERHRKIVEQIIKKKVDFVVNCGDLVWHGGRYEQWEPQFFEPLKGLAESVPVYAIKGNHDLSDQNYFEKLLVPPGQTANFSFDYGPVHYYCADNYSATEAQVLALIAADMNSNTYPWKFVGYHEPSLNFGTHWSDWGYPDALPALARAGTDFVVTGHSHQYERFRPLAPPAGTNGSFVTYITSGGGGAELHGIEPTLYHAHAKKIHHFCLFHIKANRLTMDTIDIDGQVIDHLEVTKTPLLASGKKQGGQLNKQYLLTAVPLEAIRLHHDLHCTRPMSLLAKPEKNQPFTVTYKLSAPILTNPAKITFELRSEQGAYQLPEPKTIMIPKEGGTINTELTVTPLVEVKVATDKWGRPKPIVPSLRLDCHYEIGRIQESISHRILAKSKKLQQH